MNDLSLPRIIQGGMGIAVSDWRLAQAVSRRGQLGVVSGTAIDSVFVRRLQDGDPGGHVRRAMAAFPMPGVADAVLAKWFRPEGRARGEPYHELPMHRQRVSRHRNEITMLSMFVEVFLAKEGHGNPVGVNLLTKIQMPNLALLYGAMLAGVDYVLMGAGIPRDIPGALDTLAEHRATRMRFDVEGLASGETEYLALDPAEFWDAPPPPLTRPKFLAIIASNSLGTMLARKASGRVDGFIVEGPTAGGHNAPPRGAPQLNERGEPVYGERDVVDFPKLAELGLPFWIAGGAGSPEGLQAALAEGAAGIQVGTLFAYCDESGLAERYKRSVLEHAERGEVDVFTDPNASPTGFPFKVVTWAGDETDLDKRVRVCDLGYLRVAYKMTDGRLNYRCAAEPVATYVKKGGAEEETRGRRCLCNALMANIGLPQVREGGTEEPPLLTSGDDLVGIREFLGGRTHYSAADVIGYLLGAASPA
ncbi:MAG TPA: nitronate monooxygenase [Gemmatimonadales bacterium]|nr:nitronate monooxygenase [Gemmatimonadales bacterium]